MKVEPRKNLLAALQRAAQATHYVEQTMAERLVVAIERLALRGLTPELAQRELRSVLSLLLPGQVLSLTERPTTDGAIPIVDNAGTHWYVQVNGSLPAEQQAALRVVSMATMATRASLDRAVPAGELETDPRLPGFIAVAPATRRLKGEIAQLSRSSATILITGESGSGKEVVARAVHDLSTRVDKPFVAFNCASVPRDLFEGQLFGHKKGAFTGATNDSVGVIRAAHEGTLFLDEIGELPLDTQPKLLRFLENGEVFTLGEQRPRRVDVRVLAATHRDLGRLVREGKFREDLYYRLNVVPLRVPPLRERREDIVAIARMFLAKLSSHEERPELGVEAVAALEQHTWPGNVRELRNVIERAMAFSPVPPVLNASHLRISSF
jgi:transcriptional regulator with PAS, ATPase and Fis domain